MSHFFHQLVSRSIHFATWDKRVDTTKLAQLDDDCFAEELQVNGKQYGIFEGTKTFRVKQDDLEREITLRRIYLWNKSCNRRTCGLARIGASDISLHDCARAVLNRWGGFREYVQASGGPVSLPLSSRFPDETK